MYKVVGFADVPPFTLNELFDAILIVIALGEKKGGKETGCDPLA